MKKNLQITPEDFQNLLGWFSDDVEKAGEKYEEIRCGLIRFFRLRGCNEPESLTDETINRVAVKLSAVEFDENFKMNAYFYAFASNILLEHAAQKGKIAFVEINDEFSDERVINSEKNSELKLDCLDTCLARLPAEESNLVLQYYSKNKREKTELRTSLAEEMNLKVGALHTRVHRIRLTLRNCVEKCLAKKRL